MDNTREKLIELIGSTEYGNGSLIGNNFQKGFIEKIADHLIANGVTLATDNNVGDKTNADRIRAMSDEELADAWMKDVAVCHRCVYTEECECDEYVTIEKCKEGLLEWLKQPVGDCL